MSIKEHLDAAKTALDSLGNRAQPGPELRAQRHMLSALQKISESAAKVPISTKRAPKSKLV